MFQDFKKFVLRGNTLDLAIGIVIGSAFTAVINGLVAGFVNPLIALTVGKTDYTKVAFSIHKTLFPVGLFITPLISFILVAAVLFFLVITPVNRLSAIAIRRQKKEETEAKATDAAMLEELEKIRKLLAKKN